MAAPIQASASTSQTTDLKSALDQQNKTGAGFRGFSMGHIGGIGTSGDVGAGGAASWLPWGIAAAGVLAFAWFWWSHRK